MNRVWLVASVGLCVGAIGCGRSGQFPTAKVTGTVTVNGKPVEGAILTFYPEAGKTAKAEAGKAAMGITDAQGKFELSTYRQGDGAVVGKHRVSIVGKEGRAEMGNAATKFTIPTKYHFPHTSGLNQEIKSGDNKVDLPLTE